jgi:hypothetical protein
VSGNYIEGEVTGIPGETTHPPAVTLNIIAGKDATEIVLKMTRNAHYYTASMHRLITCHKVIDTIPGNIRCLFYEILVQKNVINNYM